MLRVHFFAITDSVKNQPCFKQFRTFFIVFFFPCLAPQESLLVVCRLPCVFSIHGKKKKTRQNVSFFLWMDTRHRNVALPTTDKMKPRQKWLSDLKAFPSCLSVSDCCFSTSPASFFRSYSTFHERRRVVGPLWSDPGGSWGTVKGRLRSPPRYGGKCRVHEGGGGKQLVPANHCAW